MARATSLAETSSEGKQISAAASAFAEAISGANINPTCLPPNSAFGGLSFAEAESLAQAISEGGDSSATAESASRAIASGPGSRASSESFAQAISSGGGSAAAKSAAEALATGGGTATAESRAIADSWSSGLSKSICDNPRVAARALAEALAVAKRSGSWTAAFSKATAEALTTSCDRCPIQTNRTLASASALAESASGKLNSIHLHYFTSFIISVTNQHSSPLFLLHFIYLQVLQRH